MFGRTIRTRTALAAGVALSGLILTAPGGANVTSDRPVSWGWNIYGQLGNGSVTNSPLPVAVDAGGALAGRSVTAVIAGGEHTCAVADGRA
jgi:hypothetical protein